MDDDKIKYEVPPPPSDFDLERLKTAIDNRAPGKWVYQSATLEWVGEVGGDVHFVPGDGPGSRLYAYFKPKYPGLWAWVKRRFGIYEK